MPTSKTILAILFASLVLLDVAFSFDLDKIGKCAEITAEGGASGLGAAAPIVKKLTKCVSFKPTKTQGLKREDIYLLISSFVQKATSNPLCVANALLEVKQAISSHVDKFVAEKCHQL